MMTITPNLLFGAATDSQLEECIRTLLTVSAIPSLADDQTVLKLFNEKLKPATANDPGFRYHERYQRALEWLETTALTHKPFLAWQPEYFMQSPAIQWAVLDNLQAAKFVFVLRNPVDSVHLHYRTHIADFGDSFDAAINQCLAEMNEVGSWSYRGKWERFYSELPLTTLLLESCAYASAVYRAQTLLGQSNVLVIGYEHYLANPEVEIARFTEFLRIDEIKQAETLFVAGTQESLADQQPMHPRTRLQLTEYFRDQVSWLGEISSLDTSIWGFDTVASNLDRQVLSVFQGS